jgi:hypothetical protein
MRHASALMDVETLEARYLERARRQIASRAPSIETVLPDRLPPPADARAVLIGWWVDEATAAGRIVLPNPYDSVGVIATLEAWVWDVAQRLAPRLGEAIDGLAGRPVQSPRYWRTLLAPWLVHLLSALADRRLFCLAASAIAPEAPLVITPIPEPPATTAEAVSRLRTDGGNAGLLAVLAPELGLRTTARAARVAPPSAVTLASRPAVTDLAIAVGRRTACEMLALLPARNLALLGLSSLSAQDLIRLEARVGGLAPLPRASLRRRGSTPVRPAAMDARIRLRSLESAEPLEALALQAMPWLLPRSLLEDFDSVRRDSRRAYGRPRNALVGAYSYDERENDFLGRCRAAGKRLAFVQHGGMYLQSPVNAQERLEVEPGSPFLSWGARRPGVIPTPHPYLERIRGSHRGGLRITLIEALEPPDSYVVRFAGHPLGNQGYEIARMLAEMVEHVPARLSPRLALKRFPNPVAPPERPSVLERLPWRGPRGGAVAWMATSRLAVIPYLDTPFIEAIVIGTPTVGLWNPNHWPLLEEVAPLFERLGAAGIVHAEPARAAAHIEAVYDEVDAWWEAPETIACRAEFLERFAASGDWLSAWADRLGDLAGTQPGTATA